MNDLTNNEDERFVDFLTNAARDDYNPPPETPRDEMWAVIQAERATQRDDGKVVSIHQRRVRLWWVGVAAALVIGVGLGRVSLWNPAETGERVAVTRDQATGGTPAGASAEAITTPDRGNAVDAVNGPDSDTPAPAPAPDAATLDADAPTLLAGDAAGTPEAEHAAAGARENRSTLPYRVAAADLLTRSETFLTMFKTDGADEELNAQFSAWARTLLMQTRLMIDSPAGEDLRMRVLLEDLELALVQIVQLGGAADEEEARRIGEGLDDGQLLFKLRSLPDPKRGT